MAYNPSVEVKFPIYQQHKQSRSGDTLKELWTKSKASQWKEVVPVDCVIKWTFTTEYECELRCSVYKMPEIQMSEQAESSGVNDMEILEKEMWKNVNTNLWSAFPQENRALGKVFLHLLIRVKLISSIIVLTAWLIA